MDLQSIAAGEPPLQARKQLGADVLSGLAQGARSREVVELPPAAGAGNLAVYIVILAAALAASIILNLFLLARDRGS